MQQHGHLLRRPFSIQLLVLLIVTLAVYSSNEHECDFLLSDSSKEGKMVHTFQTSCHEGEILWRFPYSGLELTFKKPFPLPIVDESQLLESDDDNDDGGDDDDDLQFCYVINITTVNVTLLREMPGQKFIRGDIESCIPINSLTHDWIKFYIESTPTLLSSLVGKFHLLYMWSKPTPFELCRHCSRKELSKAVCSSGSIFTGRVENSLKNERTIKVFVNDVIRFDRSDSPKHFCLRRRRRRVGVTISSNTTTAFHKKFFQHHPCDVIVVHNAGRCSGANLPFKKHTDEEFIFVANTALKQFRTTCAMPVKRFWRVWKTMEARDETDCLL